MLKLDAAVLVVVAAVAALVAVLVLVLVLVAVVADVAAVRCLLLAFWLRREVCAQVVIRSDSRSAEF